LFFLLSGSLLGCSEESSWLGSVQMVDGVERIANPADPLLPDPAGLIHELWSVREADWVNPTRLQASAGVALLTDPPANRIYPVTENGESLSPIGRPGGGPGEFLGLRDAFTLGDRIAALDAGKGSVEYLGLDGTHLGSQHLQGQVWNGFPLDGETFLVKGEFLSDPRAESFGDWVTVREGEGPTAFTRTALEPLPQEEGVRCSDLSAWGRGAARLRFTTPQIQLFDGDGQLLREIRTDFPVEQVTEAEREAALGNLRDQLTGRGLPPPFVEQNLIAMKDRWKVKCRFGPLRFDATTGIGAFLEQNPDEFGSGNAVLHLLSEDGVYLARVEFDEPWRDFAMSDGAVYALARDPLTDVVSLKAYALAIPEPLLARATTVLDQARGGAPESDQQERQP
jgi:hypothetical protein